MPLKIVLKPHEKLVVNGAVLQNGSHGAELHFLNQARFLREKDILTEDQLERVESVFYFLIQLLYIDPDSADLYRQRLAQVTGGIRVAYPDRLDSLDAIVALVEKGEYYKALRDCRTAFPACLPGERSAAAGQQDAHPAQKRP